MRQWTILSEGIPHREYCVANGKQTTGTLRLKRGRSGELGSFNNDICVADNFVITVQLMDVRYNGAVLCVAGVQRFPH